MAARLRVSLSTVVQGAWALLLNRQSGADDVVFGTAFAGRPVEMPGADTVVGPFVNNLPIRLLVVRDWSIAEFLQRLHERILEVSPYQYLPLLDIQDCSEVPWRYRLFESIVVSQNYLVDDAAKCLGKRIKISDFTGPIHTAYPLLVLVEPGTAMRITLIYDRKRIGRVTAEALARDLRLLLTSMPAVSDRPVRNLQENLSPPLENRLRPRRFMQTGSQNFVPPQTDMEKAIALVWQKMFGLERVSVDENLFDLGGHSLLLVQLHARLRSALRRDFPLVTLFTYPTVRSLARFCDTGGESADNTAQWRMRAQQQRQALVSLRNKRGTN
jgi:non-ribosomal peptide synthetase component F